ncbi:GPI inositol-deacylase [Wickerhamomyces ciferrii]|uniref:GPI inositol-deacylase n=1 Tax=Wickerhamomyces ciferrii (strain ATCC 14091 / BCRC 22168 / CBS 111 / JCM 3599 / NBRC 0793 / NRRL Y-1031 F-60-10) TaxID=1206466 RepID=K0KLC8_WICCF|nr:GPI inositol-deacylase [Wickerhamomyces ciferrii]CCH43012.1 GPI inositol-deacylase [Wickerhamomyces ciferrii]
MVLSRHGNKTRSWLLLLTLFGLITFAIIGILSSQEHNGADAPKCRPIYMFPSYAKINGFDTHHSKFASKYNLFLYREQGKDKIPDEDDKSGYILDGVPVLFIPGNAGSYKQVRSIAAESTNIIHNNKENIYYRGKNLDFFAAHFNEDFTAFHGRTMLDQAEYLNDAIRYILSLYEGQSNPPQSVILVGHSMGGVVSRLMLTLPNYVENSINTIVTLSAPHAAAPATFDGDIMRVYGEIDRFWRQGFDSEHEDTVPYQRLQNVSIISITGGLLDTILPADYTTLDGLVPDTHGFTVYTTGIPGVWTPIDHLAIVWCDQLRKVVASVLLDVVDPLSPSRTYSVNKRMNIFRKNLLSGFEEYAKQDFLNNDEYDEIKIKAEDLEISNGDSTLLKSSKSHIIDLKRVSNESVFNFISSSQPSTQDKGSYLAVCNKTSGLGSETVIEPRGVSSSDDTLNLACKSISKDVYAIPRSAGDLDASESSFGGNYSPFYAAQLDYYLLEDNDFALYSKNSESSNDDFSAWSVEIKEKNTFHLPSNIFSYLFGTTIEIPSSKSLVRNIQFDSLKSSLLGYKVTFNINKKNSQVFEPLARQWISNPFETKWHLNLHEDKTISFHGNAPYTPFKNKENPLHLQLWALFNDKPSSITVKIDLLHTLKLWVLRYRLAVASLPIFIITLTLTLQILQYSKSGIFISFEDGLILLMRYAFPIGFFASILTPLASNETVQKLLYLIDFVAITKPEELKNVHVDPYFLGIQENYLWILGPIFLTIALSLVYTVNKAVQLLGIGITLLIRSVKSRFSSELNSVKELQIPIPKDRLQNNRRIVGSVLLLAFVVFYVPYQFAYVVCCVVQGIVCIKSEMKAHESFKEKEASITSSNFSNYNKSLFVLMLWILPVNIPVLVVFFHNMAVKWETPFSSHHNILAILPIILVLSKHVKGEIIPQPQFKLQRRITVGILIYFAFFSLVYGVRHLYWLHYLLNVFFAWIFILFYEGSTDTNAQNN